MEESDIFKFICANRGAVDTEDLCNVGSANVSQIIRTERFLLCGGGGGESQEVVVARTWLRLCRAKDCPGTCSKLHLCKHVLFTGVCSFTLFRGRCVFSHELNSDHNARVLREHKVESLSRTELCTLLLQNDHSLTPNICHDYNNGDGMFGLCQSGVACERLHICERYLRASCTCSRTHNFSAPQPLKILKEKDVPDEMINSLKFVYKNKEALRLPGQRGDRPQQQPGFSTSDGHAAANFTGEYYRGRGGIRGNRGNRGNRGTRGNRGNRGNRGIQGNRGIRGARGSRGNMGIRGNRGNQEGVEQLQPSGSTSEHLIDFDDLDLYTEDGLSEDNSEQQQQNSSSINYASSDNGRGGYQGNRGNRGNLGGLQQHRSSSFGDLLAEFDNLDPFSNMGQSEGFGGEMRGSGVRGGYQGNRGNYGRDKTEICMHFIIGHCKHEDKCFRHHDKMPYRWQVKEGIEWTALPKNEDIEKDFCDPQKTHSGTTEPVDFDIMTCGPRKVRRLSTCNSLAQPAYLHTTEWIWYWEDEFAKWNVYASSPAADMESSELEKRFLANPRDVVDFIVGSQSYSLSFQDMIQTNNHYSTKRLVRRRPRFVSGADVRAKRIRRPLGQPSFLAIPDHWDKTQIPATGYKRVSLQRTSQEFMKIQAMFFTTMRGFDIVTIERIQNKPLWESFQLQKTQMRTNNGGRDVQEKNLFHGTDSVHVDAICLTNFDWRICGTHGTAFGTGSYFARDAKYSHSYTDDSDVKSMFISRVLVGDFTKGSSDYRRPPSKDGRTANLYDSCVDDVTNPSIYVVFERQQIYPEYLLQYKTSGIKTVHSQPATYPYVTTAPSRVPGTSAQSYTASNQPSNTVRRPPATNPFVTTAPSLVRSTSASSNTASNQPSNLSYNSNSATFQYPRSPSSSSLPEKKPSDSCVIA